MGKTKKKSAQNPNAVTKQLIHGIKNDSVQKNKSPKSKGVSGSRAALTDNSKMQNENKPSQKNLQKTTTKSNQNLLQNNKKEDSLKRKKNTSNKSQNKPAKKMKKKELEVDDLQTYSSSDTSSFISDYDNDPDVIDKSMEDNSSFLSTDSYVTYVSSSVVTDDEEMKVSDYVQSTLGQSLAHESEEDFEGKDDEDDEDEDKDVEDNDNDNEDENDKENKKFMNIAIGILESVGEGKYVLPFPTSDGKINRTSIKIENLPKDITESEIKSYFEKIGPIKSIKFRLDIPTGFAETLFGKQIGRPDHFFVANVAALIDYHCPLDAEKALRLNGQMFLGNYMIVDYTDHVLYLSFNNSKCVMLRNMPEDVDINTVWKMFKQCGQIKTIYLYRDRTMGIRNGEGLLYFSNEDAVSKAIELNGALIFDREVIVEAGLGRKQIKKILRERADIIYGFLMDNTILRAIAEDREWREKARQNKLQNLHKI